MYTRIFIALLLLNGCFSDPNPVESAETGAAETGSSSAESIASTATLTTLPTQDPSTSTSGSSSSSEESTTLEESSTDEESGSSSESSGSACAPVEVPVAGSLEAGETMLLSFDFDEFPGEPGATALLCATFSTNNVASSRTISVGAEVLPYGPCGGRPSTSYTICAEYLKPSGSVDVLINNTPGPGCQNGDMSDLVLSFECA